MLNRLPRRRGTAHEKTSRHPGEHRHKEGSKFSHPGAECELYSESLSTHTHLVDKSKEASTCRRERSNISPETALMTDSCFVAKFRICWGFWFSLLSYFLLSIDVLKYAKLLLYLQQGLTATDLQVMNGSFIFIFISLL